MTTFRVGEPGAGERSLVSVQCCELEKLPKKQSRNGNRACVSGSTTLMLLMGVLILQALGHDIGFFLDPASGMGEFSSPPPIASD